MYLGISKRMQSQQKPFYISLKMVVEAKEKCWTTLGKLFGRPFRENQNKKNYIVFFE